MTVRHMIVLHYSNGTINAGGKRKPVICPNSRIPLTNPAELKANPLFNEARALIEMRDSFLRQSSRVQSSSPGKEHASPEPFRYIKGNLYATSKYFIKNKILALTTSLGFIGGIGYTLISYLHQHASDSIGSIDQENKSF